MSTNKSGRLFYSLQSLSLLFLLRCFTHSSTASGGVPPFNISHYIYPFSVVLPDPADPPPARPFFQDVLKEIARSENWTLQDVRVSKSDKFRFADLQRLEFPVRLGKSGLVFKLLDQVSAWKKLERVENESDFQALVGELSSKALLQTLKIQGPVRLRVRGEHNLSLHLPSSLPFRGLKDIHVSEGITVEIKGAEEVSVFHSIDLHKNISGSGLSRLERSEYGYFWPTLCIAWPPISIVGSAAVVAYRTQSSEALIESAFLSNTSVQLLPVKCYSKRIYQVSNRVHPLNFLTKSVALLERVVRTFVGRKGNRSEGSSSVKVNIKASAIFRFQLELERDVHANDSHWSTVAEWRTRPDVERLCFEVVGRLSAGVMKALTIKQVGPFSEVESNALSHLFSNVSFTQFPSFLVPQEALTLDVKW